MSKDKLPPADFTRLSWSNDFLNHAGEVYWKEQEKPPPLGFYVAPHMCNVAGVCHGGMLMTVLDTALAISLRSQRQVEDNFTPSITFTYYFLLKASKGMWLESFVDFTHITRRLGFVNGGLRGAQGVVVKAQGVFKVRRLD